MSEEKLEVELETLARLLRQLPEVEEEVDRCEEALDAARSNVEYVRSSVAELRSRVCNLLMPPNIVVAGPALTPPEDTEGGLFDPVQQETSPVQSATEQDKARELPVGQAAEILGYEEAKRGAAFGDNPYDHSTISHTYWDAGWTRACHEKMAEDVIDTPPTDTVAAVEIPEGFVRWEGGECPVDGRTLVDVILASGTCGFHQQHRFANSLHWDHEGPFDPIIAYKVISEPAEASEDDEPAEIISTLTGDPAIEPESGLHGEPLPPSELDSQAQAQAQPQTKSEQSDNPPEEKFSAEKHGGEAGFWTKALEQDRKPQPGIIEETVSRLFGRKMEEA